MSALAVKLVAEITMFGDHFAAALWDTAGMAWRRKVYWVIRSIARIAFPIFGFQLSEGARHTSNRMKYLLRLCIFALLSEPFFDRALFGSWYEPYHQNVYFTLIAGYLVMLLMKKADETEGWKKYLLFFLVLPAAYLLGDTCDTILYTDYGQAGVFMLTVFSVNALSLPRIRSDVKKETVFRILVFLAACAVLVFFTGNVSILKSYGLVTFLRSNLEIFAFLGVIPVALYSGLHGKMPKKLRILFYAFYPLHLAILSAVLLVLG